MINCVPDIIGVKSISLNQNEGITITRPNIAIESEINVTYPIKGTLVTNSVTWARLVSYSDNYKKQFTDTFKFYLYGINPTTRAIIQELRTNRLGFIAELTLKNASVFLFQSPVFVSKITNKKDDLRTWEIEMSYRVPTFLDKLIVLEKFYYYTQFDGVNEYITITDTGAFNFIQNTSIRLLTLISGFKLYSAERAANILILILLIHQSFSLAVCSDNFLILLHFANDYLQL